jgi:acetylglutamate kinase
VSAPTAPGGRLAAALVKAGTLVEALPWLQTFRDKIIVVKYGGNAMTSPALQAAFAQDMVFLYHVGLRPVVVHGGGPQISRHLDRLGVPTRFTGGLRVTDADTMKIVRMVLVGEVNRDVVGLINAHGPYAVGLSGEDANLLVAERRPAFVAGEPVDVGFVGDVAEVTPDVVTALLADARIPVVATVARGTDGQVYNVNADTAAAALAVALGAEKLVLLTDVEGLYEQWPPPPGQTPELISELTAAELESRLPELAEGMVPKMEACLRAVRGGVPRAHVLDGRLAHALLLEIVTDAGVGTMVTA